MDSIAPPLKACLRLRLNIENGQSIKIAIQQYVLREEDTFASVLQDWLASQIQGVPFLTSGQSFLRIQFLYILGRGLEGKPIAHELYQLEEEMIKISKEDINSHLDRLPSLALIPLLSLQFPAFLLVLLGPTLEIFSKTLGGL